MDAFSGSGDESGENMLLESSVDLAFLARGAMMAVLKVQQYCADIEMDGRVRFGGCLVF